MDFICRVGTPEGRVVDEVHRARDERSLRSELEGRGYHVFTVRKKGLVSWLPGWGGERSRRVPTGALLLFNQEMAALLHAGLPVLQSLEMMAERQREPVFREVLGEIRDQVKTGRDLSDAVAAFGDAFPALYAPTLRAGERTGELEQVIRRFVRYQDLLLGARRRVISALVYPAVLICLSLLLIGAMTFYVVPKFTEFFSSLNRELPILTRGIIGFSVFFRRHWVISLAALAFGGVFFTRWRQTRLGERMLARWRLRLPLVGGVFQRMAASEFTRSLATLLAGGIPVVTALENSVGAVGNTYIRSQLAPVIRRVREGTALYAAIEETGTCPEIAVDMIKVGEATGSLDAMLVNASDFLDQEVETRLQRLLSLLEPIMLVLMGTIVAILLLAIYLPLFNLLGDVRS